MIEIRETVVYKKWFDSIKDRKTRSVIDVRIRRVSIGNFGDVEPVGNGISELKIDYGTGFRIYFLKQGNVIIFLLCGGNKSSQAKDILKARELAERIKDQSYEEE